MTQADWVKEFEDKFCQVIQGDLRVGYFGEDIELVSAKELETFISKVESLAQQRTEKKWRRKLKQISFFVEGIPSEGHRNILTTALGDLLK